MNPDQDRDLAVALVSRAAALAAEMRASGTRAERKTSAADLVTAADRAAEDLVHGMLAEQRPGDGVTGEEGAHDDPANGRRWTVDPIDGTYNYVAGLPPGAARCRSRWTANSCSVPCDDSCPTRRGSRARGDHVRRCPVPAIPDVPLGSGAVATFLNASHLRERATAPLFACSVPPRRSGSAARGRATWRTSPPGGRRSGCRRTAPTGTGCRAGRSSRVPAARPRSCGRTGTTGTWRERRPRYARPRALLRAGSA